MPFYWNPTVTWGDNLLNIEFREWGGILRYSKCSLLLLWNHSEEEVRASETQPFVSFASPSPASRAFCVGWWAVIGRYSLDTMTLGIYTPCKVIRKTKRHLFSEAAYWRAWSHGCFPSGNLILCFSRMLRRIHIIGDNLPMEGNFQSRITNRMGVRENRPAFATLLAASHLFV